MRKKIEFIITREGRDKDKLFVIEEMSAFKAEKWAMRAVQAAARGGIDLGSVVADEASRVATLKAESEANPEDKELMQAAKNGMQALVFTGLYAIMQSSFNELEPLIDEMFRCVSFVPDKSRPNIKRPPTEDDILEVSTLFDLRSEVLKLHAGFLMADGSSTSPSSRKPTTT